MLPDKAKKKKSIIPVKLHLGFELFLSEEKAAQYEKLPRLANTFTKSPPANLPLLLKEATMKKGPYYAFSLGLLKSSP